MIILALAAPHVLCLYSYSIPQTSQRNSAVHTISGSVIYQLQLSSKADTPIQSNAPRETNCWLIIGTVQLVKNIYKISISHAPYF